MLPIIIIEFITNAYLDEEFVKGVIQFSSRKPFINETNKNMRGLFENSFNEIMVIIFISLLKDVEHGAKLASA